MLLGPVGAGSASAGSGRYIVGTTSTAATREARRQADSVRRVLDFGQFGQAVAGPFSRDALRGLSVRRDVRSVEPAGNDGPGTADEHYPPAYPEVIAVAATERYQDDSGELFDSLAYFSSTGSVVEIGAPGRAITSRYKGGDYKTLSGMSMACPHVSGAGGLLIAAGYTAADARTQLGGSAETPVYDGEEGRDMTGEEIGNGLLDVRAATGSSGGDTADDGTAGTLSSVKIDVTATDGGYGVNPYRSSPT